MSQSVKSSKSAHSGSSLPTKPKYRRSLASDHPIVPVTKYYELNQTVLDAFDAAHAQQQYPHAYTLGLKFLETALVEIPKHAYFNTPRHDPDRLKNAMSALGVVEKLEQMQVPSPQPKRVALFRQLAVQQVQQAGDEYEQSRKQAEESLEGWDCLSICGDWTLVDPAPKPKRPETSQGLSPLSPQKKLESERMIPPLPDAPPLERRLQSAPAQLQDFSQHSASSWDEDEQLQRALYLSGLDVKSILTTDDQPPPPPPTGGEHILDLSTLRDLYHEDFCDLQERSQLIITYTNTYQGKVEGSINGCTVIAPLLCLHHFLEPVTEQVIQSVVDEETPNILHELRTSLGLPAQAFLIPSDAHDYLIEHGQLSQEQFVTVIGGNVLDNAHLQAAVQALVSTRGGAATLYFHEHVVALLQVPHKTGCWYDLIDGLPLRQTLLGVNETREEFHSRTGVVDDDVRQEDPMIRATARMRCLDAETLVACLRWHACSKFTSENMNYIDAYDWNDTSTDFDPRVFQAFVWKPS